MKKIAILLLLSFNIFLFTGCSQNEPNIIFEPKLVCVEMSKSEQTQEVDIRVHKDDLVLFQARKQELEEKINFYESQVDRYSALCKEQENKNFPRENETGDKI